MSRSQQPPTWQFSLMAPIYDFVAGFRPTVDLAAYLPDGESFSLLDLGGGTGSLEAIPPACETYVILDRNHGMLAQKARLPEAFRVRGTSHQAPWSDNTWDVVLLRDALHHMGPAGVVLEEIQRLLRPGGRLILEEFNPTTPMGWTTSKLEWLMGLGSQFYPPDEMKGLLRDAGFSIQQEDQEGLLSVYTVTA